MWCVKEGLIDSNPAAFTDRRLEVSRDRVLTEHELRTIWRALTDNTYSDIVRLLILNRSPRWRDRRIKMVGNRFEHGDDYTAPSPNQECAHEHPSSPQALAVLAGKPRLRLHDGGLSDHVFTRSGRGYLGWSGDKIDLDARIAKAGSPIQPWVRFSTAN